MSSDGRDIALKAIRFQAPTRLPTQFFRWGRNDFGFLDFGLRYTPIDAEHKRDEFGCVWEMPAGHTLGYVVEHPLSDLRLLSRYRWPDPDDPKRFDGLRQQAECIRERGLAVCCNYLTMLWERLWILRGFENTLIDCLQAPGLIEELLDPVADHMIRLLGNAQEATGGLVDVWCSTDDLGSQTGPFLPPEVFARLFKPRYSRIFAACRKSGMLSYMHSDGQMCSLLPDLIEAGLQVLQVEDVRVKGLDTLAGYRGRITFQCTLDAQSTMPSGDRERISAEADALVCALTTPQGGFVASIYWDPASCGVSEDVQEYAVQAFQETCDRLYRLECGPAATTQSP